jgi:hypothetical protein
MNPVLYFQHLVKLDQDLKSVSGARNFGDRHKDAKGMGTIES